MPETLETVAAPSFQGSEEEQRLAAQVWALLRATGRFFPETAPIRAPLSALVDYFAQTDPSHSAPEWEAQIRQSVQQNPHVFILEDDAETGTTFVITTRAGRAPTPQPEVDVAHMLPRRFQDAPPATAVRPRRAAPTPAPAETTKVAAETITPVAETVVDPLALDEATLERLIIDELSQSPEIAHFGDQWMLEEDVPRLSRGDLRRLRDYILEQGKPLSDVELVEVILGIRQTSPDFSVYQFGLNYRLAQEGDFEFVGVPGLALWTTKGAPGVTTKRRAADIGQDYRFLLDEPIPTEAPSEPVVDHVLTFYEHYLGVLPYDATLAPLLPKPVLPDQRVAVLTFESPQTYETFPVELRYPSGNRGGYLAGFEAFFQANLVPGALITIERSDEPGHYLIEFLPISPRDEKLLTLDEKRNRYVFRQVSYRCAVQEQMLLSENRYPKLAGQSPLDERTRRSPDRVLAVTFERVGEQIGTPAQPRYMALLDDLLAVANVERPMTAELIAQVVHDHPDEFSVDPDAEGVYYYTPKEA